MDLSHWCWKLLRMSKECESWWLENTEMCGWLFGFALLVLPTWGIIIWVIYFDGNEKCLGLYEKWVTKVKDTA